MSLKAKKENPTLKNEQNDGFLSLTGFRAVAASLIFFNHYLVYLQPAPTWANDLQIGVSLFYTLSGFLIMYRYSASVSLETSWLKNYWIRRFARIYPVYFVLLVIQMLASNTKADWIGWVMVLTLTNGFFEVYAGKTGIPASWSLTVEECFYFSAPFLMLLFRRRFWYPLLTVVGIALFGFAIAIFQPIQGGLRQWNVWAGSFLATPFFVGFYTFFGRVFEFYVGMLMAWALLNKNQLFQFVHRIPYKLPISLFGICLVVAALNYITWGTSAYLAVNALVLPFFTILLIYSLISESTWLSRFLESRFLNILGKSSYIFYLIHFTATYMEIANKFSIWFIWRLLRLTPATEEIQYRYMIVSNFVFYWGLSILIYYILEKPANRLIRSWAK